MNKAEVASVCLVRFGVCGVSEMRLEGVEAAEEEEEEEEEEAFDRVEHGTIWLLFHNE